ncbi:hypothetical protein DsansV1_C14g0131621 [Dioscorea sansibarensis]
MNCGSFVHLFLIWGYDGGTVRLQFPFVLTYAWFFKPLKINDKSKRCDILISFI